MLKNLKIHIVIFSCAVALLASCSPAKHCAEPDLALPSTFFAEEHADTTTLADIQWWNLYSDTLLQNLIMQTLERNKDMQIAYQRVEELRQLHRIAKAGMFPSISAQTGGDHEWTWKDGGSVKSDPEPMLKADISWEVDLWGVFRWSNRKAAAEYLASIESQRAMQMTLIAEVAKSYFELIALDNQLRIVNRTLITREEGVSQARLRFEGGLTSETSYQQAKVELATTASEIPGLRRKIALKESQISLLAGSYPDSVKRSSVAEISMDYEQVPYGIPSGLLKRRPDIRRAEQNLMAAQAAVGVAQAARFPTFTINLSGGFENDDFKAFFQNPILYAAGKLVAPLFSFGKKQAKFKASISAYNQSALEYEKTVMEAFKEVNDAVITYRSAKENTVLKKNLMDATKKYVDLARLQYINGVITYLDVLDAQRKFFSAQVEMSTAICNEYLAIVDLYKVLGGGW